MNTIWVLVIITQAGPMIMRSPAMEFWSLDRCNAAMHSISAYKAEVPNERPFAMKCVRVDIT